MVLQNIENEIYVFSNGVGFFKRYYKPKESGSIQYIEIPVDFCDLNYIISSIRVYPRDVVKSIRFLTTASLEKRKLFSPFDLDFFSNKDAFKNLVDCLSGHQVEICCKDRTYIGHVLGLIESDEHRNSSNQLILESLYTDSYGVCSDNKGVGSNIKFIPVEEISEINIGDNKLIDKFVDFHLLKKDVGELNNNLSSVVIELMLDDGEFNDEPNSVCVSYIYPISAWITRYDLSMCSDGNGVLEGEVVFHNYTLWRFVNTKLFLVYKMPQVFSSDVADVLRPVHQFISLYDRCGLNPQEPTSTFQHVNEWDWINNYSDGVKALSLQTGGDKNENGGKLVSNEMDHFCIIEIPERILYISPWSSMLLNLGKFQLKNTSLVPVYRVDEDSKHPRNLVVINNELNFDIKCGMVNIYIDGIFSGSCACSGINRNEKDELFFSYDNRIIVERKSENQSSNIVSLCANKKKLNVKTKIIDYYDFEIKNVCNQGIDVMFLFPVPESSCNKNVSFMADDNNSKCVSSHYDKEKCFQSLCIHINPNTKSDVSFRNSYVISNDHVLNVDYLYKLISDHERMAEHSVLGKFKELYDEKIVCSNNLKTVENNMNYLLGIKNKFNDVLEKNESIITEITNLSNKAMSMKTRINEISSDLEHMVSSVEFEFKFEDES